MKKLNFTPVVFKYLIVLVGFFVHTYSFAQINVYQASLNSGMIVKNWLSDDFPARKPSAILSINLAKQTTGAKAWQQFWDYPQVGVKTWFGALGNQQELGYILGAAPTLSMQSSNPNKRLRVQLGIGLSGFNQPFDSITNPTNILIGSHVTALGFLSFYYTFALKPSNLYLHVGTNIVHSSNGHIQIPNVGMNLPMLELGIAMMPDQINYSEINYAEKKYSTKWHFNLEIGTGVHEFAETTEPVGTPKYQTYTARIFASRNIGYKNIYQMGVMWKYYASFRTQNTQMQLLSPNNVSNSSVAGIFMGDEVMMGKLGLILQGALDLHNPFYKAYDNYIERPNNMRKFLETWTSTRFGLQYNFRDPVLSNDFDFKIGMFVNANFGEADFMEITTAFRF